MAGHGETIHASRARRRRTILRAVAVVVLLGALTYLFVFSRHGYLRRRELARENERLHRELDRLQTENARLRGELESLDDPEAVEKLAREKLGLVHEGETVYRFVEKDNNRKNAEKGKEDTPPEP